MAKSARVQKLETELANCKLIIRESAKIQEEIKAAYWQQRYEELAVRCKDMIDALKSGMECKVGRCPWCGEMWPNPADDNAIEAILQIAMEHDNVCKSNPLRIERDELREAVIHVATIQLQRREDAIHTKAIREVANRLDRPFSMKRAQDLAVEMLEDE